MGWVAVLAVGLGAGAWIRHDRSTRALQDGQALAAQVADRAAKGRQAEAVGDLPAAEASFREALALLRLGQGPARGDGHAALLVDLASATLRGAGGDPRVHGEVRELLDEAWATEGISEPLRARVALDQGALATLGGDAPGAERWYGLAAAADPGDPRAKQRIEVLLRPLGRAPGP